MALDHYVSQVHLKNFYSAKLGELMHAIRKRDMHYFTPNAPSVCRIKDGSTNEYLKEQRIIEEFLKDIEPFYNKSIKKLCDNKPDYRCIYVIAGFISYVLTCSPAGMRINKNPLRVMVEDTGVLLEEQGVAQPPPPELGGESIKELFEIGKLNVNIDPKYPQAIGISNIVNYLTIFANCSWEVLINEHNDSPFFTSDFPVAFEQSNDPNIFNKIVPLRPNLAVRILPHRSIKTNEPDYTFSGFKHRIKKINRKEVRIINRLIVRCAEELVFFCDLKDWITPFVKKNSQYYIEPQVVKLPGPNGQFTFFTHSIVERDNET